MQAMECFEPIEHNRCGVNRARVLPVTTWISPALSISPALLVVAACGFPRPPDVPDDDSSDQSTIHVSASGDDSNDGITQPVKTLKRAIGIASGSSQIAKIALASGSYSTASGETFPY